jgi:hypothetical protein
LKDLLIPAFTSLGVTLAGVWVAARFLGEKLFGHWLEGRLQRQKQEHAVELEQLKNEQNRQIELLRADIGYLQDRGKHSNEREYAALAEIWEKFWELHTATDNCIRGVLPVLDLQRMDDDRIAKFLDKSDLTEDERAVVQSAADKDRAFSRVFKMRSIAQARSAYFDFRARFDKQNIFIPKSLADDLYEAADQCWRAVVQLDVEARKGRPLDMMDDLDFLKKGPQTLRRLNDAVRERLHRE